MSEIDDLRRRAILTYRFVDSLSYNDIATRVPDVTADGARHLCTRAKERAGSDNIRRIYANGISKPRQGRPRRIQPSLPTAIRIRQALRDPDAF